MKNGARYFKTEAPFCVSDAVLEGDADRQLQLAGKVILRVNLPEGAAGEVGIGEWNKGELKAFRASALNWALSSFRNAEVLEDGHIPVLLARSTQGTQGTRCIAERTLRREREGRGLM